jgi:hypothetical protein
MSIREANANRVLQSGNTNAERTKNNLISLINREFSSSPFYHEVLRNNIEQGVQIVDESSLTKNPNKKRVLCKPDEDINIGDDILWNSVHWLCTNVDSDKEIYAKGIIERCNNTLTFQLPNGTIKSYPCIITDKSSTYADGTSETKYIILSDDQILITIQNNTDTLQLELDHRFIFNHSKNDIYKLSKIQSLIQEGILYLTMTKDQKGVNDRLDLNLADYVQNNFVLTITNGDTVSLNASDTLQLICEVRNNGVLVETPTITYQSSDITKATVSITGLITAISTGVVTITATSNGVSDNIEVTVEEVVEDNYSIIISGSNSIYQGQSKSYSAIVYNNGTQVAKDCVWSVSDTTLTTITAQNSTSATVKASSSKLGTVSLRCEMVEDNTIFSTISIQVKSIV